MFGANLHLHHLLYKTGEVINASHKQKNPSRMKPQSTEINKACCMYVLIKLVVFIADVNLQLQQDFLK